MTRPDESRSDRHVPERVTVPLCIIIFFSVLNGMMFNVVIPDIAAEFHLLPSGVSWVMTGYILVFGLGSLIVLYNIFWSRKNGEVAGHNPWNSPHLEWAIPSPPHHYNFPVLPEVRSREPLWHEDEKAELEAQLLVHADPEPEMPNPSFWPMLVAAGITFTMVLVMTGLWWAPLIGLVTTFFCMYKWATEPQFG